MARYLDHAKPAGEQERWVCVAIGSALSSLLLQVEVTKRHGMEAGVVSLTAMTEREIAKCRLEARQSKLIYHPRPSSPSGGDSEGA
jgi:hypothetical protein